MLIGYMRVSSNDERQSVSLQRDALIAAEWIPGIYIRIMLQVLVIIARDLSPVSLNFAKVMY